MLIKLGDFLTHVSDRQTSGLTLGLVIFLVYCNELVVETMVPYFRNGRVNNSSGSSGCSSLPINLPGT